MAAAPGASDRWLYGPARDLLVGCGLGYLVVFAAMVAFGGQFREQTPEGLLPLLMVLVGAPHYGATLLRVYDRRQDRRAYALFSVWISLLLLVAFAAATRWIWLGSLLFTIYVTWNPWHYAGQNYGLAVMFLRRRGVALEPQVKRWIYASFVLTFVLTTLALHRQGGTPGYVPLAYGQGTYGFLPLGIPGPVVDALLPLALLAYLGALGLAGIELVRRAGWAAIAPTASLALTQSVWFVVPLMSRYLGVLQGVEPLGAEHHGYYFFLVAMGHSIQYVWVTCYYARRSPGFTGYGAYLSRATLAGTAIWTVPGLLFAPQLLGRLPFDLGLGALVASVVNLHHFVLDGAIWKLRGPVARVLLRAAPAEDEALPAAAGRSWGRAAVAVAGAVSLVVVVGSYVEYSRVREGFAARDTARVGSALSRLQWMGRDDPELRTVYGALLEVAGDPEAAAEQYRASVSLHPTPRALRRSARLHEQEGQLAEAAGSWARLARLDPGRARPHAEAGRLWLAAGDRGRAIAAYEAALERAPDDAEIRDALRAARARPETAGAARADG